MNNYTMVRGWMDHDVFKPNEPFTRREAWIWLIENAHWKNTRIRINHQMTNVDRGQLSHSLRFMGEKWLWQKDKVRRFIIELKNETMIETVNETGQIIITICNYDKYQLKPNFYETPKQTANETSVRQPCDSRATKKNTLNTSNTGNTNIYGAKNEKSGTSEGQRIAERILAEAGTVEAM